MLPKHLHMYAMAKTLFCRLHFVRLITIEYLVRYTRERCMIPTGRDYWCMQWQFLSNIITYKVRSGNKCCCFKFFSFPNNPRTRMRRFGNIWCKSPVKFDVYLLASWIKVCRQRMYNAIKCHHFQFIAQTVWDTSQLGIRCGLPKINAYYVSL